MFATQTKSTAAAKGQAHGSSTQGHEQRSEPNPFWQSLALRGPAITPLRRAPENTLQRLTVEQCTTPQNEDITGAVSRAFADLNNVLGLLSQRPVTDRVRDALWMSFRDSSDHSAELVTRNIRRLRENLPGIEVRCRPTGESGCGDNDYGVVETDARERHLYLCMPYFSNLGVRDQARALIHEAAHFYLGLLDTGYFTLPQCRETPRDPRSRAPEDRFSGTAGDNPAFRLNNADAYACFVHFLVNVTGTDLAGSAASYRGENLRITPDAATVFTRASDPTEPSFRLAGVPFNSGFRFRWTLIAGGREFRLESTRGIDTWTFSEDTLGTPVFITNETRAILSHERIRSGIIQCEIQLYRPLAPRFDAPVVRRTIPVTIVAGEDPFDISGIL